MKTYINDIHDQINNVKPYNHYAGVFNSQHFAQLLLRHQSSSTIIMDYRAAVIIIDDLNNDYKYTPVISELVKAYDEFEVKFKSITEMINDRVQSLHIPSSQYNLYGHPINIKFEEDLRDNEGYCNVYLVDNFTDKLNGIYRIVEDHK